MNKKGTTEDTRQKLRHTEKEAISRLLLDMTAENTTQTNSLTGTTYSYGRLKCSETWKNISDFWISGVYGS